MKNLFLIMVLTLNMCLTASAQYTGLNDPSTINFSSSGFISILELSGGLGLAQTENPYSKYIAGVTSINGYNIDRYWMVGVGIGAYFYNDGFHMPVYADIRFTFPAQKIKPYLIADGGFLIDFDDAYDYSKIFINPGAGISYRLTDILSSYAALGMFIQQGNPNNRDSFVNLKIGIMYKPY